MKLENMIREKCFWFKLLFKIILVTSSMLLAFLLRFDMQMSPAVWTTFENLLPPLILIKITVFWRMGLNHGWWRYVSLHDVIEIFKANVVASLAFMLYLVIFYDMRGMPRSVLILDFTICFLFACGVRFITRAYRENRLGMNGSGPINPARILVVGAGCAGQMIVREVRQNPSLEKTVVGYIDDDESKHRQRFLGVAVMGTRKDIPAVCREVKVDEIIIAIPSASGEEIKAIVASCRESGIGFKTLPGVGDLIDGTVTLKQARDVDLDDLLGRKPVRLETVRIRGFLSGKRVLVTGAAGSIGSEICRQVAGFGPARMVLLENAETPLFDIERELVERFPDLRPIAVIGDVRDRTRVESIFEQFMPEIVFHAAAYKHVPMMECNPAAAVHNNVHGTRVVADASHDFGVQSFVMISTDKAVNPTSVMGTTKRVAELYVQNFARYSRTRFVTVRFGNVLGSNGSVVPIFREQIRKGGPVRVTHPEVIRYFMTIPEATQLVLQAGSMGRGGEIFILDMGEPVKIAELAEEMIRLSGFRPHEDIDIVFTGLRPGEKLFEELLLAGEGIQATSHEKIKVAKSVYFDWNTLNMSMEKLYKTAKNLDAEGVSAALREIVPEYGFGAKREKGCVNCGERTLVHELPSVGERIVFGIRELPKPKGRGVFYCRSGSVGNEMFLKYLDLNSADETYLAERFQEALHDLIRRKYPADEHISPHFADYETENMQPWAEGVLKRIALAVLDKGSEAVNICVNATNCK